MRMRSIAGLLAALLALLPLRRSAQDWKPSDGDRLEFDVLRDGGEFGTHVVAFRKTGDELTVDSDIDLKVTFGPADPLRIRARRHRSYTGGRLMWVGAQTKNEGKWKQLSAEAAEGGLKVAGAAFKGLLTGVVIPSTHWNADEMKQPAMFSTETGEMLPMKVKDRGLERVKVGAARSMRAATM